MKRLMLIAAVVACLSTLAIAGKSDANKISIDIKPGSDRNPINLKSKGVVPVAVFGAEDFDLTLMGDPIYALLNDRDGAYGEEGASAVRWAIQDLDLDGYYDLILHFSTQELADYLDENSLQAVLTLAIDGQLYQGVDWVTPFKHGKKK